MKLTPGERICVLVNGQPVDTIIDDHGTQRFLSNDTVRWLIDSRQVDLNVMCLAFYQDAFTLDAYMEFYMSIGYSICGFEEIFGEGSGIAAHAGQPVEILNPVWEHENETVH